MTTTHAAAAKIIRKELKKHGIQGSVRSSSYSNGSSIQVTLIDPLPATLKAVREFASDFQYGSFNGMEDIYEFTNNRRDIPQVKYVLVNAEYSDDLLEAAEALAKRVNHFSVNRHIINRYTILAGDTLEGKKFWRSRKPRQKIAA